MDPRMLIDAAQKGNSSGREILYKLPGLLSTNNSDLANLIKNYIERDGRAYIPSFVDKKNIAQISEQFHMKAGTLTGFVESNLHSFLDGNPIIRIAHTPDQFSYLAVFTQFIYLDSVSQKLRRSHNIQPAQIFIIVDFDVVEDKHHRVSYFPDIERRQGVFRISAPLSTESFDRVQYAVKKPSQDCINEWFRLLERYVDHNLTVLYRGGISHYERNQLYKNLELIENEIREAYDRATNLSEFDTIFMSRILNLHWKLPIAFFPLSKVAPFLMQCYEYLLKQYPRMVEISHSIVDKFQSKGVNISNSLRLNMDTFPFWYICENCSSRLPLKLNSTSPLIVETHCRNCGKHLIVNLGSIGNPKLDILNGQILPRVLFDSLTDVVGWQVSGGVGYEGSAEHVLVNSMIASEMGYQVPPECLWRPRGIYYGLTELRALQELEKQSSKLGYERINEALKRTFYGRSSILYFLLSQGFDDLHRMWKSYFENGGQLNQVNIGRNPSSITKEQDLIIRAKLKDLDAYAFKNM